MCKQKYVFACSCMYVCMCVYLSQELQQVSTGILLRCGGINTPMQCHIYLHIYIVSMCMCMHVCVCVREIVCACQCVCMCVYVCIAGAAALDEVPRLAESPHIAFTNEMSSSQVTVTTAAWTHTRSLSPSPP